MAGRRAGFSDTTGQVGSDLTNSYRTYSSYFNKDFVDKQTKPYADYFPSGFDPSKNNDTDQQLLDIAAQAVLKLNKIKPPDTNPGGTDDGNPGGNPGGKDNNGHHKKPPPSKNPGDKGHKKPPPKKHKNPGDAFGNKGPGAGQKPTPKKKHSPPPNKTPKKPKPHHKGTTPDPTITHRGQLPPGYQ